MQGRLKDLYRGLHGGSIVTIETSASPADVEKLKDKIIEFKEYKARRSLDANALLWACIGEIAGAITADKWTVYLMMLRRYGQFVRIAVPAAEVDNIRKQWREIEVVGEYGGVTELLCYYGSSTYDTKQFSILLDGVISEMKEMGLRAPDSGTMRRTLAAWAKKKEKEEQGVSVSS